MPIRHRYVFSKIDNILYRRMIGLAIKANRAKARDAKPRVLASCETLRWTQDCRAADRDVQESVGGGHDYTCSRENTDICDLV